MLSAEAQWWDKYFGNTKECQEGMVTYAHNT